MTANPEHRLRYRNPFKCRTVFKRALLYHGHIVPYIHFLKLSTIFKCALSNLCNTASHYDFFQFTLSIECFFRNFRDGQSFSRYLDHIRYDQFFLSCRTV